MKHSILLSAFLFFTSSVWSQTKSKFNTMDKNTSTFETKWNGSISYGNTIFIGDLNKASSEKYLPNVALSLKFNKEFTPENSLLFSITSGKNSGEITLPNTNLISFKSQYTQGHLGYRKAITPTGIKIPQIHLNAGIGYYYADGTSLTTVNELTSEVSEEVWSLVFPFGMEISYYVQEEWGVVLGISNTIFTRDTVDFYDMNNNVDHQLIINLGICYSFN